jgi:hypothetical protein
MFKHTTRFVRAATVFALSAGLASVGSTAVQAGSPAHSVAAESHLSLTHTGLAHAAAAAPHGAAPAAAATPGALAANASATLRQAGRSGGAQSAIPCDGHTDATAALQAAVDAGGTVNVPAGTCILTNHIAVHGAVTISGAGSAATFLVQHSSTNIFQINADNVTVENLNLDTATFNPGPAIPKLPKPAVLFSRANNTHLFNVTAEAGSGFGMRFTGPSPCASYQRGGTVLNNVNVTTTGTGGFAAVDIDCQNHATATGITIHGGILALFNDENTTVNGETFTPGPLAKTCAPPWYITGPAASITVQNVMSHGGPGVVRGTTSNITILSQIIAGLNC